MNRSINIMAAVFIGISLFFLNTLNAQSFGEFGPIITGSVVDSLNGQPLSDATISILDQPSAYSSSINSTTSVTDGSFIDTLNFFFNMGTAGNIRIAATKPGYYLPGLYRTTSRMTSTTRIALLPYHFADVTKGIKITVKDSITGTVIAGATATLFDYDSVDVKISLLKPAIPVVSWMPVSMQKTDNQGVAAFFSDTIGNFMVQIDAPGYVKTIVEIGKTGINDLKDEVAMLIAPVTRFDGLILDSLTQKPVKNASAQLRRVVYRQGQAAPAGYHVVETVSSDEQGRYSFERLAQSTDYRVYVTLAGYYPDSTAFEVPAFDGTPLAPVSKVTKLLTSRGGVTGIVSDAFSSHPVDSAIVYLSVKTFKKTGTIWEPRDSIIASTRSKANGTYSFSGLEADYWYAVHATYPLYKKTEEIELAILPAQTLQEHISIWLASGLNATVRDSLSGKAVSGAVIVVSGTKYIMKNDVLTKENFVIDSAVTDSTGKVSIPLELNNVVNRNYSVTLRADGYSNRSETFAIDTADPVKGFDFELVSGNNPVVLRSFRSSLKTDIRFQAGFLIISAAEPMLLSCYDLNGRLVLFENLTQGIHRVRLPEKQSAMMIATLLGRSEKMVTKKISWLQQ